MSVDNGAQCPVDCLIIDLCRIANTYGYPRDIEAQPLVLAGKTAADKFAQSDHQFGPKFSQNATPISLRARCPTVRCPSREKAASLPYALAVGNQTKPGMNVR